MEHFNLRPCFWGRLVDHFWVPLLATRFNSSISPPAKRPGTLRSNQPSGPPGRQPANGQAHRPADQPVCVRVCLCMSCLCAPFCLVCVRLCLSVLSSVSVCLLLSECLCLSVCLHLFLSASGCVGPRSVWSGLLLRPVLPFPAGSCHILPCSVPSCMSCLFSVTDTHQVSTKNTNAAGTKDANETGTKGTKEICTKGTTGMKRAPINEMCSKDSA